MRVTGARRAFLKEGPQDLGALGMGIGNLGRVAVEWRGIIQGNADRCFLAFRKDEGVDKRPESFTGRQGLVFEDGAQQARCPTPFVALKAEQDRGLVREILIQRSHADAGALGDSCGGESLRAFRLHNLNSGIQNRRDQIVGPRLPGCLSRGDAWVSWHVQKGSRQCE